MRCGAVRFEGRGGCANVRTKRKKQAVARRGGRDQMDGSGEFRQQSSLRRVSQQCGGLLGGQEREGGEGAELEEKGSGSEWGGCGIKGES